MKRIRAVLVVLAFALAGIIPTALSSAPASAQTTGSFCLANAGSWCITTHGAGAAVTLQNTGITQFYTTVTTGGQLKFHVSGSTHCLTVGSGDIVADDCQQGDGNQEFDEHAGCQYSPKGVGAYLIVNSDTWGAEPYIGNKNGAWYDWTCW